MGQQYQALAQQVAAWPRPLAEPQPVALPLGEAPPGQQYGANLIALSVNWGRELGLRPAELAMIIVFAWMNSSTAVPSHEAIRGWMQRVGLGRVHLAKKEDGGTWLVDHTNQIGPEKVLTVWRVRSAPSDGQSLRHQDLEVLATIPSTELKRDDVAREYRLHAVRNESSLPLARGRARDGLGSRTRTAKACRHLGLDISDNL